MTKKGGCGSCFVLNVFGFLVALFVSNALLEMSRIERDIVSVSPSRAVFLESQSHPIVLYDGVCNLCNGVVQTLLFLDDKDVFRFAPLQSAVADKALEINNLPNDLSTVVFIDQGRAFLKSTAAIRVLKHLSFPLNLLYGLIGVPRPVRDFGYDLIASSRYKLFGNTDQCVVPPPSIRHKFIDQPNSNDDDNPFCL